MPVVKASRNGMQRFTVSPLFIGMNVRIVDGWKPAKPVRIADFAGTGSAMTPLSSGAQRNEIFGGAIDFKSVNMPGGLLCSGCCPAKRRHDELFRPPFEKNASPLKPSKPRSANVPGNRSTGRRSSRRHETWAAKPSSSRRFVVLRSDPCNRKVRHYLSRCLPRAHSFPSCRLRTLRRRASGVPSGSASIRR